MAQTGIPVTMVITGDIAASSDGKIVPTEADKIIVIASSTGKTVASAVSQISAGGFGVTVSDSASLNGTVIALRLVHAGSTFKLLNSAGAEATIAFNGSVLPLGSTVLNLVASSAAITTPPPTGGTGSNAGSGSGNGTNIPTVPSTPTPGTTVSATSVDPSLTTGDINADGVTDAADVAMLKDALAGRLPVNKTTMDVNSDGVVNSRDLIDLIRAVRAIARAKLVPLNNIPKR